MQHEDESRNLSPSQHDARVPSGGAVLLYTCLPQYYISYYYILLAALFYVLDSNFFIHICMSIVGGRAKNYIANDFSLCI